MKGLSGKFENGQDFKPFIVSDGQLITGQNPKIFISCCWKSGRNLGKG